jgi:hypothetical protein
MLILAFASILAAAPGVPAPAACRQGVSDPAVHVPAGSAVRDALALHLELRSPRRVKAGEASRLRLAIVNTSSRPVAIDTAPGAMLTVSMQDGEVVWRSSVSPLLLLCPRVVLPGKPFEFVVPWGVSDGAHPLQPGKYVVRAKVFTRPELNAPADLSLEVFSGQ